MKTPFKSTIIFLLAIVAAAPGLFSRDHSGFLVNFTFKGQSFTLNAVFSLEQADLQLQGKDVKNLSAGMEGENILLGTRIGSDNFFVFWLNHRQDAIRLAYYDNRTDCSRILALTGFSFIGLPDVVEENGELQGLVFLGNRSNNDDIFYYELEHDLLTPLTETPFSEKGFQLLKRDGRLEIETRSLRAQYRYRFDPVLRKNSLVAESPFSARRKKSTPAIPDAEYFNTFIGFGDSITWGEIEGDQHMELCYLTQMQDLLADPGYANYYGASSFVNLGVPGDNTAAGAERIDQDLDDHSGFYLLLMLGVNDVINSNMSIDSVLENLGYIIDAAKARGMRIIVSTLTPSKSIFSFYSFYWENLRGLSKNILILALKKKVASIDTLTAFLGTNPPDGWQDLLEDVIPNVSSGNHPNAAGHGLIASLFAAALVKFPPQPPQDITVLDPEDPLRRTVSWSPCFESDFSHFHVEFGFLPGALNYFMDTAASYCWFNLFPFLPQLYFRIQAVDRGAHQSEFVTQDAAVAASGLRIKKPK